MAELKTSKTTRSVARFLRSVEDESVRSDCQTLIRIMEHATASKASMWGTSIVGFGSYHYRYDSGREGEWFLTGFSPRKQSLTIYIMAGFDRYDDLMAKLGKFRTGKSCLYVRGLHDVRLSVLSTLIGKSVRHVRSVYR